MEIRKSQGQKTIDYTKQKESDFFKQYSSMIQCVNKEIEESKKKKSYRFNFNDCYFFKDSIIDENLNIRKLLQKK
jgi:hypothetical protein